MFVVLWEGYGRCGEEIWRALRATSLQVSHFRWGQVHLFLSLQLQCFLRFWSQLQGSDGTCGSKTTMAFCSSQRSAGAHTGKAIKFQN